MANYSTLISQINNYVKQNGEGLITGQGLQTILDNMVAALGGGALYKGEATAQTSPGTPDTNVWYVAGPGTYNNFGGAVVHDGYIGFLSYNGSWSLAEIEVSPAEIGTDKLANGAVTTPKLADGAATTAKLANGAVTEAKLASALITKLMQTGYKLAGVATTSTNPGTPDQYVFYLAASGTYTHFGSSFTINPGFIGVIRYNGSWSHESIQVGTADAVKYTEQTLNDSEKAQARKNIGAADENTVKQIANVTLTAGAYDTGATLNKQKQGADYYSVLIKAQPGTIFVVAGRGGSASIRRLWATYNAAGERVRVADSSLNTTQNPVTITLSESECYLVVNTTASQIDNSYVLCRSLAANLVVLSDGVAELAAAINTINNTTIPGLRGDITTINANVQQLSGKIGGTGLAEFTVEQGGLSYALGVATSSATLIRTSDFITAEDGIEVSISNGKYMVFSYAADGSYLGHTATYHTDTRLYKIDGAAKYKVVFAYTDESAIVPSDFPSLGAAIVYFTNGNVVRVDEQTFTEAQKEQARTNIGAVAIETVNPVTDAESDIEWTLGKFLRTNGTLIDTSAKNKVGKINIQGYKKVEFNYLTKAGGSVDRYGYTVTDSGGNILLHSDVYPSNRQFGPFEIALELPDTAVYLNISWTSNPEDTYVHYLRCHADIGLLYARVAALEGGTADGDEEANIENAAIQLYRTVRYNNNDYSYTRLNYVTNLIQYPNYQLPAPVVFETKVDSSAQSRHLMIADNSGYIGAYTISLDLTSEQVEVYNLEPGKDYYYKVYKDNDPTAVIGGGLITTTGQIRFVKIAADVATNGHDWIDNVRDLGGWPASGNRRLRYGAIFRGEQLNNDDETMTYITQAGIQELRRLGVSAELDLRGGAHTQSVLGNDVAYVNFALSLWFYYINIYNTVVNQAHLFADAIRQILAWLEAGKGIYIHCAGGCDRTGALCAMIEGLCGVSENDINHDYELSNRDRSRLYYHIEGNTNPETNKFDGDFRIAMEYIKGLIEYNNRIYVYYRGSYYDAEVTVTDHQPVALTDASLIANLAANNYGSLQDRFERLMCGIGGLLKSEAERLRTVLCS